MTVAVEGNRTDEVLKALRGDPAVCALHTTNGRWDIVAELRTDSLEAVDRVLGRIRQIDGISTLGDQPAALDPQILSLRRRARSRGTRARCRRLPAVRNRPPGPRVR